nr:hypothetical protein CFP56_31215 [Quercus suber]
MHRVSSDAFERAGRPQCDGARVPEAPTPKGRTTLLKEFPCLLLLTLDWISDDMLPFMQMIAVADIDFSLIDSERAKMPIAKDSYYMEIGKEEDK